jgi:hypothetical protein
MTIAAILALAVVAFAAGAYAYLVYSPKPRMPSLSTEVQHATMRVGDRERSYLAYVPARLPFLTNAAKLSNVNVATSRRRLNDT